MAKSISSILKALNNLDPTYEGLIIGNTDIENYVSIILLDIYNKVYICFINGEYKPYNLLFSVELLKSKEDILFNI